MTELQMEPTYPHAMADLDGRLRERYLRQPPNLQGAAPALRNDPRFVLAAVQQDGLALRYAAHHLRDQATIGLAAVRANCRALAYVSDALRSNVTIATAALPWGIEFVAPHLLGDTAFMLVAIEKGAFALLFASKDLRNSRAFVRAAVEANPWAIFHAPSCMHADVETMTDAMERAVEVGDYARVRSLWRLEGCRPLKQRLMDTAQVLRDHGSWSSSPLQHVPKSPADFAFQWIVESRRQQQNVLALLEGAPSQACRICIGYSSLRLQQEAAIDLAKCSRLLLVAARGHQQPSWWIFFDRIRDA